MRLYLAGPMTGYPDDNFRAFAEAAEALREKGFEVVAPHEGDLSMDYDPRVQGPSFANPSFDLATALSRDVEAVLGSDGVALLPGWQESPGALVEVLTAEGAGLPWAPVDSWLEHARLTI